MAVEQYPRGEPIVDQSGRPTDRFLRYLVESVTAINTTQENTDNIQSTPSSVSRIDSFTKELRERIENLEGFLFQSAVKVESTQAEETLHGVNNYGQRIANIEKEIQNIIHPLNVPQIKQEESIAQTSLIAQIAELNKRIQELEALL